MNITTCFATILGALTLTLTLPFLPSEACTDFLITAKNGNIITGRTMDYTTELTNRFYIHPPGEHRKSTAPNGQPGLEWTSSHAYIAANGLGLDFYIDGMNERGLSMGLLTMPGTEYENMSPENYSEALILNDLGSWILGNFSTIEEVKDALPHVFIWTSLQQTGGASPSLHLSLHDANGNSLVVEFLGGQKAIYHNPIHVLTNFPAFDWQLINLGNYLNLTAINATPVNYNGLLISPNGQGSGLVGLPGDWTSPSRFVRTALLKNLLQAPKDAAEGIIAASHLLNAVDIIRGSVNTSERHATGMEFTQWAVIKDLTNKVLYFRTYDNMSLQKIDFSQIKSSPEANPISIPIMAKKS